MRDPRIEATLNANPNLAWEYVGSIGVHQIDKAKSFANQARVIGSVDSELVTQYRHALRQGDQFPALVVYEDKPGTFVNIDGNHRYSAYLGEKRATTDAYVVLADNPLERIALTFELNTLNGRPTSDDDRAVQAVALVNQGFTRTDICGRLHVSFKFIEQSVSDYSGAERARKLGVQTSWAKIPSRDVRVRLQANLLMDKVFAAAVVYTAKFQPKVREIQGYIETLNSLGSEEDQVRQIKNLSTSAARAQEEARKEKKLGGKTARKGAPPQVLFGAHLAYFMSEKMDFALLLNGMVGEEREEMSKRLTTTITKLQDLAELLNG